MYEANSAKAVEINQIIDSDLMKVISERVRLEIIRYLVIHGPSDITTIAANFTQDRSVISRHLKMMCQAGLVTMHKQARFHIYTFDGYQFLNLMERNTELIRKVIQTYCEEC